MPNEKNNHFERAYRKYGTLPFQESHHRWLFVSRLTGLLSQLLGGLMASYYVFVSVGLSVLPSGHSYQKGLALCLTIFCLLLLETFKRFGWQKTLRAYYKRSVLERSSSLPWAMLTLGMICLVLSVFSSFYGARQYTVELQQKAPEILADYETRNTELGKSFALDIAHKKQVINDLEAREKRRKWGLTDNESATLQLTYKALESFKRERKEALEQLQLSQARALRKDRASVEVSLIPVLVVVLSLEFVTLICLGFAEYFDARIIWDNWQSQRPDSLRSFEKKYPRLLKALKENQGSLRPVPLKSLAYSFGVSESTLKRIRQEIRK